MITVPSHEAHGICQKCHTSVHRYPFGWAHVNLGGMVDGRPCQDGAIDRVQITCCVPGLVVRVNES